ncbi:hypothetical protein LINPERHAP2_LOCUS14209 [Linum perenne]
MWMKSSTLRKSWEIQKVLLQEVVLLSRREK